MQPKSGLLRAWDASALTIAAGSSISSSMIIAGTPIVGLSMDAFWTAASISFDVSACPGGVFLPLYNDNGNQLSIPVTACTAIAANTVLDKLSGWFAFRIRSGCGVASPTDQGSARTIVAFIEG